MENKIEIDEVCDMKNCVRSGEITELQKDVAVLKSEMSTVKTDLGSIKEDVKEIKASNKEEFKSVRGNISKTQITALASVVLILINIIIALAVK